MGLITYNPNYNLLTKSHDPLSRSLAQETNDLVWIPQ